MNRATQLSRRHFFKRAAALMATGSAIPHFIPSGVLGAEGRSGANDRVIVGVIGTGARAGELLMESPSSLFRIAAVADCNAVKMESFSKRVSAIYPEAGKWQHYGDHRQMLDKVKLDGVFVETTTHARVLCCVQAMQAGMDVYCEKPETLTIEEGQVLIQAVRKYGRILQGGTQHRSINVNRWACELVRSGAIGKVQKVVCQNYAPPLDWKPKPAQPVPDGLDWDLWLNQVQLLPFHAELLRWPQWRFFDGGGGWWGLTGWGTHAFDQVQWALGKDHTSPVEVWPATPGDRHSAVSLRYDDGIVIEMSQPQGKGPALGGIFIGEKGKIEINRNRVASNPPELVADAPDPEVQKRDCKTSLARNHVRNWIECIRSRKQPNCPVEAAHRHSVICHMATVARDLGRRLKYDPSTDRFVDDEEANRHPSVARRRRKGYELPTTA